MPKGRSLGAVEREGGSACVECIAYIYLNTWSLATEWQQGSAKCCASDNGKG